MYKINLFSLFAEGFKQNWQDFKQNLQDLQYWQNVCQNLSKNIGRNGLSFATLNNPNSVSNIVVFGLDFGYDTQNLVPIKTKTSKKNL
ncbi:hypothetical protein [Helicobacter sp. T3_23-1056]